MAIARGARVCLFLATLACLTAYTPDARALQSLGLVVSLRPASGLPASYFKLRARAGQKVWTPLVAVSLMVFVVFCMQCLSTLAIAKKETGHWGWPVFMFFYMTTLAWVAAFQNPRNNVSHKLCGSVFGCWDGRCREWGRLCGFGCDAGQFLLAGLWPEPQPDQ